jgi:hypothetical protein
LKKILDTLKNADVRDAAKKALLQLLEPLAGFVLDSGISTSELNALFREAAVISAVSKQLGTVGRVNISGIAATTGIPRAEISRILRNGAKVHSREDEGQQQSTNRILSAWHGNPKFTKPDGQPADLKLFGRGSSFDCLARMYGRGIPTRALLDELVRTGAVELLDNQRIRAKTLVAVERGMSARVIKSFGDRGSELLSTMLFNMRRPEVPKFIANITDSSVPKITLPLLRKELALRGADFLADVQESLNRSPFPKTSKSRGKNHSRISVTIFYHESTDNEVKPKLARKRRNFRREN